MEKEKSQQSVTEENNENTAQPAAEETGNGKEDTQNKKVDNSGGQETKNNVSSNTEDILSDPRINEIIRKAREEEKQKLYGSIDKLKNDLKSKTEFLDELKAERDKALEEKRKEEEAAMSNEELLKSKVEELSNQISTITSQLDETKTTFEEKLKRKDLDLLVKDIINQNQGSIIPSMIGGDSEEEILKSLEASKAEYERIEDSVRNRFEKDKQSVAKNSAPKPTPTTQTSPKPQNNLPNDVRSLDAEQLAKVEKDVVSNFLNQYSKNS